MRKLLAAKLAVAAILCLSLRSYAAEPRASAAELRLESALIIPNSPMPVSAAVMPARAAEDPLIDFLDRCWGRKEWENRRAVDLAIRSGILFY